jgi:hypothetical protein
MADLPELSESTRRKLTLRWTNLLDTNRLTGEHLHWHERELGRQRQRAVRNQERRLRIQEQMAPESIKDWYDGGDSPHGGSRLADERAADGTGIAPTVALAEARFKDLFAEFYRLWLSSGDGYEGFAGWLDILRRQVTIEVASVWEGGPKAIRRWYKRACGPAVEKALTALVKRGTTRARADELKRLEQGETPTGKSQKSTKPRGSPSIIGGLPKDAIVRMKPATARREAVDAYIEEIFSQTGKRITRTEIWKWARYKTRTEFERWERNDPKNPNKVAHERFMRILWEKPHLK